MWCPVSVRMLKTVCVLNGGVLVTHHKNMLFFKTEQRDKIPVFASARAISALPYVAAVRNLLSVLSMLFDCFRQEVFMTLEHVRAFKTQRRWSLWRSHTLGSFKFLHVIMKNVSGSTVNVVLDARISLPSCCL